MYEQEQIKPYNSTGEKGELVERMFDNIAPSYDKLNHRLSLDIDKYWRHKAIKQLKAVCPKTILDIATGTGDFAILAAEEIKPEKIIGVDISEGMMQIASNKVKAKQLDSIISIAKGDCMNLSFDDNSFDAVTSTFGIRNFQDLERGLCEMHRVLRPGGMLCILELTSPVHFPMKQLFRLYSNTVLPTYGKMVSKDNSAYKYLNKTIAAFPQGERMVDILHNIGFADARFKRLSFGICTMYTATKQK